MNISIKNTGRPSYPTLEITLDYDNSLYFVKWPTQNCRVFAIAPFSRLINGNLTKENIEEIIQKAKKAVESDQTLILFDIKQSLKESLKTFFEIVCISDYTSSNGSKMCTGIVKSPV